MVKIISVMVSIVFVSRVTMGDVICHKCDRISAIFRDIATVCTVVVVGLFGRKSRAVFYSQSVLGGNNLAVVRTGHNTALAPGLTSQALAPGDPLHWRSHWRWPVGCGGLKLMLCAAGWWWAGLCVQSGTGETFLGGASGERRVVAHQHPLHKGGERILRSISGQPRSALIVKVHLEECAEAAVREAGVVGDLHEDRRVDLERHPLLLQQEVVIGMIHNKKKKRKLYGEKGRRITFYRSRLLSRCGVGETHEYEEDNGKQSLIHPHKGTPHQVGRRIHTYRYIYITFSHFADAFIQSDLQLWNT